MSKNYNPNILLVSPNIEKDDILENVLFLENVKCHCLVKNNSASQLQSVVWFDRSSG